ncbi:TPA: glycerol-3-phosphate dehydrogenase [Acinetobacter nosocomialis]|uniref:Glycerol-3-phosphate dehydrogenase n=1 Tax=Acinetobacter nosocomialis TaxID=106654 RepID=A0AB37CWJ8_ACINO|nr:MULTISPECIES: glycerol-3-phosphate dehydrogenase [Acinetobacter calcoaceticus/baumannii complex]ELW86170.1 glycerol-3-phosphate dehydrogenase [Acinetobacter sp. OIFC021]EXE52416.1 FAD dependent oxidoreductase family protein [Acinetobacter sp. 766875]MDE1666980.1 glycerol-3-phosphate dehydrogenase [Acinetobacter nosocomialis]MDE9417402.1 glycerol-3-phosphate dehydrogenase [Acinetobacter nosocomialis]QGA45081.1 glycerol-3-phosphate dehydrogenase [Acinetobacter nosocomialis]
MTVQTNDYSKVYDIAVIGGGINGVGIANDAVGRGLSVFLCEKDDLASHTSSASSKLIHGGLRYLEHKEFRLVREALAEREVLLAKAPHIIAPMRFIMPHRPHLRPAWLIRAGLFFYDHLGKREKLLGSNLIYFKEDSPLKPAITRGFEYSDCTVDDARLVVLNALQAKEQGAKVVTRTRCVKAYKEQELWHLELQSGAEVYQIRARALVNAAGPWVEEIISENLNLRSPYQVRLIQGSHIVVPKLYDCHKAFIMQNEDRRIVFAIPYLEKYTLIGTTDQEYTGDPQKVEITDVEIDYLLTVTNSHFKKQLTRADIVSQYSGVRALCDDESDNPSAITRDYTLALQTEDKTAPLLSVFGGKITTYRKLAEAALEHLSPFFSEMAEEWTANEPLPGAENWTTLVDLINQIQLSVNGVSESLAKRWAHAYGTRVWNMLHEQNSIEQLGQNFGHDLFECEVKYLCEYEWANTAEDILWRRSKLGLAFNEKQVKVLEAYLSERRLKDDAA